MRLNLDQVRLAKDGDLDGLGVLAHGVVEVLHLGNDPDQVNIRHRLAHETGHDTETTNLDLELPVENLILERRNKNLAALGGNLGPSNRVVEGLELLVVVDDRTGAVLLGHGAILLVVVRGSSNNGEVARFLDGLLTPLVDLDLVEGVAENGGGSQSSENGDDEEERKDDDRRALVAERGERPLARLVVDVDLPRQVRTRRSRNVEEVGRQRVGRKAVDDPVSVGVSVKVVVKGPDVQLEL